MADLVKLIQQLENLELETSKDVIAYGKLIRKIGNELYLQTYFRADELESALRNYQGKWYHFGASTKVRARLVTAHLRIGADGVAAWALGGVKMTNSFHKHFVGPERAAQGKPKTKPKSKFEIFTDDD
ncbi:hypothetical protein [Actinomadura sp. WAC 06369]|uniref:hypothetical protein n=1 Tax=Actinomadura sp. WAC 06369 TaxID=2203193 RepID=UPI000F7A2BAA|nr:hypothetical protein [Actinomadura sp. WAC 06369]RSN53312.1 hypothetical protein DMH08_27665 [Actinomadura sp. WAC 06369]